MVRSPAPWIARLLSGRDRLSRQEKDRILREVLEAVAPPRSPGRRRALAAALAGAVAALVLVPLALRDGGPGSRGSFSSRAAGASDGFSLTCAPAPACRQGGKLLFDLGGPSGHRYFAAFARRPDGAIVWYFPAAPDGGSLDLRGGLVDGVLGRGVVLDREHPPGRYQVFGVFSDRPLDRAAVRARFDQRGDQDDAAVVVTREIAIQ